jgi:hypothetical protein
MRTPLIFVTAAFLSLVAAACSSGSPAATTPRTGSSPSADGTVPATLAPGTRCTNVRIDWIVAFRFGGVTYSESGWGAAGASRALTPADLGPEYGKITFRMDDQCDPSLQMRDGWSTVLPPSTPVYEVRGYSPRTRLAALFDDQWALFDADTSPSATVGADLVDLSHKVTSIEVIASSPQRSVSGSITDPATVARLVEMVTSAPVVQDRRHDDGDTVTATLIFRTADGLDVARNYFSKSGEIVRGIMTPQQFQDAIARLLAR